MALSCYWVLYESHQSISEAYGLLMVALEIFVEAGSSMSLQAVSDHHLEETSTRLGLHSTSPENRSKLEKHVQGRQELFDTRR